jgi:hypothetical protein
LSDAQNAMSVETAKDMLRILHESETNDFNSIATSDESWFQYATTSSKMFARSAADAIPRTRQAVGAKNILATVFLTTKKFIVLNILPRGIGRPLMRYPNMLAIV